MNWKRRAAAIDIGTNAVLLAVAEASEVAPTPVFERSTITRLGAGVDRTRRLADDACDRTLACLSEYRRELDRLGVDELFVVGTSALRDAAGGDELVERARQLLGVAPRVLSGREEAELTFEGACVGLDVSGRCMVFDVGGGSTELVVGTIAPRRATIESAVSLDIGSVRLFERHVRSDPPNAGELEAIERECGRALASAPPAALPLIGVAGTVTTLSALAQRLESYDSSRVHGSLLARSDVERLARELAAQTLAARTALPALEPGRADVIVVGARIVLAVMRFAGASELVVSDGGVRWGLLARAL